MSFYELYNHFDIPLVLSDTKKKFKMKKKLSSFVIKTWFACYTLFNLLQYAFIMYQFLYFFLKLLRIQNSTVIFF